MDERISRKAEFDYMMNFVEENSFDDEMSCDWLRMLWTAFCLHRNLDADTHVYDCYLMELWRQMQITGDGTSEWDSFSSFELFMCKYLV